MLIHMALCVYAYVNLILLSCLSFFGSDQITIIYSSTCEVESESTTQRHYDFLTIVSSVSDIRKASHAGDWYTADGKAKKSHQ